MALPITEDLAPYFQTLAEFEHSLDWWELFGNDHPVELDIGCGRGLFLVRAAESEPNRNWCGFERDYREGRRGARRLKKWSLDNARVLGGDVRVALGKLIEPESVSVCHVYFPDPWWKRRHKVRRLFNLEFVDLLDRVLQPGGDVHSWTDVEDYFEVIANLMNHDDRFEALPPPEEREPEHDMDYQTSFERKKRKAGSTIHRGHWRKHCSEPA